MHTKCCTLNWVHWIVHDKLCTLNCAHKEFLKLAPQQKWKLSGLLNTNLRIKKKYTPRLIQSDSAKNIFVLIFCLIKNVLPHEFFWYCFPRFVYLFYWQKYFLIKYIKTNIYVYFDTFWHFFSQGYFCLKKELFLLVLVLVRPFL